MKTNLFTKLPVLLFAMLTMSNSDALGQQDPKLKSQLIVVELESSDGEKTYADGDSIILSAIIKSNIEPVEGGEWLYQWQEGDSILSEVTDSTYTFICQNEGYDVLPLEYMVLADYIADGDTCYHGTSSISITVLPRTRLELSTDSVFYDLEGGEQTIRIKSDKAWSATVASADWLEVEPLKGDKGEMDVTLQAAYYEGSKERTATIEFVQEGEDGKTSVVEVIQKGEVRFKVEPDSLVFEAAGGKDSISVESNIEWELESPHAVWLDAIKGFGNILVVTDENKTVKERRDTLTIHSIEDVNLKAEIVVVQKAGDVILEVDPSVVELAASGDEEANITIQSNIEWTVSNKEAWLTVIPTRAESDDPITEGYVTIKVEPNDKTIHRTDTIRIAGDTISQDIIVIQTAKAVTLSIAEGYKDSYIVAQNDTVAVSLSIENDDANPNECEFTWMVEGPEGHESITESGIESQVFAFEKEGEYEISVCVNKDGVRSNTVTFKVTVLHRPPKPKSLVRKGNGESYIMIVLMDANGQEGPYEYEFGYTKDSVEVLVKTTSNRYCQYSEGHEAAYDNPNVRHWVRTVWKRNDQRVCSEKCYLAKDGKNKSNKVIITRGHLIAYVDEPTPANVTVVAITGQMCKTLKFSARTDFDEQLDLSTLPAGLYIIKATIGNQQAEEKIVVK